MSTLLISLSMMSFFKFDYGKAWKEVNQLMDKGLPKSALEKVDEIYEFAIRDNHTEQVLKSTIYRTNLVLNTEELGLETVVSTLEKRIAQSSSPSKEILHSMAGELMFQYYSDQFYKISQRTNLADFQTGDIRTWAPNNFRDYVADHYLKSVNSSLKSFKTKDFCELLANKKEADVNLRPTIYDLMVDRAISYFSTKDYNVTNPSFGFSVDDESYFAPYDEFLKMKLSTDDEYSRSYQVLLLLQDQMKHQKNKGNDYVLADYDLKRLNFLRVNAEISNTEAVYEKALRQAIEAHENGYNHSFIVDLAKYYTNQAKYKEGVQTLEMLEGKSLKKYIKAEVENLKNQINQKSLSLLSEQVVPSIEDFVIQVSSRNVETVYFKLVKLPTLNYTTFFDGNRKSIISKLEKLTPERVWNRSMPNDMESHVYKEIIDKLSYGMYAVIASNKEQMGGEDAAYSYTAFYVSDIACSSYSVNGRKQILTRNRQTGKPIKEAKVIVNTRFYDNQSREWNNDVKCVLITDKDGYATYTPDDNHQYTYRVEYENDVLDVDMNDYYSQQYKRKKELKTEIFTDRAIYRPGQTVFFKTLSYDFDKMDIPHIVFGQELTVMMRDANGKEVGTVEITTNEFGSASGSFVLPFGQLTGSFSIQSLGGWTNIKVEEYKRPKFEVSMDTLAPGIQLGEKVNVTGQAKALSGASISNAKGSYTVQRKTFYGWWDYFRGIPSQVQMIKQGGMFTDGQGRFAIEFDTTIDPKDVEIDNPSYTYEVVIEITDASGETRTAVKKLSLSKLPFAYSLQLPEVNDVKNLTEVNVKALTNDSKSVNSMAILKITELKQPDNWQRSNKFGLSTIDVYDKDEYEKRVRSIIDGSVKGIKYYPELKTIHEAEVLIVEQGTDINIAKHVEGGKAYKIELISKKQFEGRVVKSTSYIVTTDMDAGKYPVFELLYLQELTKPATVGKDLKMLLGTSEKELTVYYRFVRDEYVVHSGVANLDNEFSIEYTPTDEDKGGISLVLDYVKYNTIERKTINVELPWSEKMLDVELITKRDKVTPGSKEEWILKISGENKDKVLAEVLATMYDASLDQFVSHDYKFYPYPNHYGYLRSNDYGFYMGFNGLLNSKWQEYKYADTRRSPAPQLIGISMYGYHSIKRKRNYSSRNMDAVQIMSDAPPPMAKGMSLDEEGNIERKGNSAGMESVSETAFGQNSPQVKEIPLRKNIKETVFFFPHLQTDKQGNLLLKFKMNEAMTKWKLLLLAHDKELRYGITSTEVKTQKELMIVPNAPRFIREGDQLSFPATVSNLTEKDMEVTAIIELVEPTTDKVLNSRFGIGKASQRIHVPAGESARVDWDINVPTNYKKVLKYRVVAQSINHTDGEENILPVLTNKVLVTSSQVVAVKGNETKHFTFDELSAMTGTPHRFTFEFTSNPVWYAVQALPTIMDDQSRNVTQIFNKFYANALASHIANKHPRIKAVFDDWKALDSDALLSNLEKNQELKLTLLEETPWVRDAESETEQKKRIALLFDLNKMSDEKLFVFKELQERQLPDGSFSWYSGGRGDVFITQNIIEGLMHLQFLGVLDGQDAEINTMVRRAMMYADEQSTDRFEKVKRHIDRYGGDLKKDHLDQLSIQYLYIRSFSMANDLSSKHKAAYAYYLGQAEKYWLGKGLYSEAMIGLTLGRSKNEVVEEILKSLKERSFYSEELGRYWNTGNGFQWYDLPIETHAMMIELFTEEEVDKPFVEDMKVWLLKNKQTNRWSTTKGTAAAIYALLIGGERGGMTKWISESENPIITVGREFLNTDDRQSGTGYFKKQWSAEQITKDMGNVTVENKNSSIAFGGAYYQYFSPIDKVESFRENPLKIKRNLFVEQQTDRGVELVEVEKKEVVTGDRIIVRIEIKVDRAMSYVHLKDMRASGLEPENVISRYKWQGGLGYYESTRDLASHFFISRLEKGTYVFEYPMRTVHKGDFSGGMTTLQCMYAPEFISRSNGTRIKIN